MRLCRPKVARQAEQPASDSEWAWADSIDARALRRMAHACLPLLKEPERWIHRRVEQIYFKDYKTARHQVSVDFTLPPTVPPVSTFEGRNVYVAPLFLLRKSPAEPLRTGRLPWKRFLLFGMRRPNLSRPAVPTPSISDLDFVDQDGQRQTLITRSQSRLLATIILLTAAQKITGEPVGGRLKDALSAIANREWGDLKESFRYVFDEQAPGADPRRKLQANADFRDLAYALASHSLIACLFTDRPPRRAIYKLSYDEPLSSRSQTGGRVRRSLGWKSEQLFVQLNEIGAASSYHVEVSIPSELEVNATGLYGTRYQYFGRKPQSLPETHLEYDILQVASAVQGDIYVPDPLAGRRVGAVWVKLRACRPGFLRGALAAALVTSAVLWGAVGNIGGIVRADRSEAAVALLLLMPAILAAYVVRPGEHAITTKMLTWARIALVVDAALPFAAALFLMTAPSQPGAAPMAVAPQAGTLTVPMSSAQWHAAQVQTRRDMDAREEAENAAIEHLRTRWIWLASISLVLLLQFIGSYVFPRPHGTTRYRPLGKAADV